ncbi:MAG: FG-GAP repeat protein [Phycisphaerae bacterium]|nr:FG-GAP repeat protein [Phycisphaerae bacterium]
MTETAKLLPSDGAGDYEFGTSVAASGDRILVGSPSAHPCYPWGGTGAAYVFEKPAGGWVNMIETVELLASDGVAGDKFGYSVAISGDAAVIGAWWDDDNGANSGSAYVFRCDGSNWIEEAKLLASDGEAGDWFGQSVAIYDDSAVIGAEADDDNGGESGSAYVFRYNGSGWGEEAKLLASDGAEGDFFGFPVALSGNTAVIGAWGDNDNGESGSAYIFRFDGSSWVEEGKLSASDGESDDYFGFSVAISSDTAVIGAYRDDDDGSGSGSAYVFGGMSDCQPNGTVDICDITYGTSQDCQPNGVPDECEAGDFDGDGDVDLADFAVFSSCFTGPGGGPPDFGCGFFDLEPDNDVDLDDYAALAVDLTGP